MDDLRKAREIGITPLPKTSKETWTKITSLEEENNKDWEIYVIKIPVDKILKEVGKLPKYDYQTEQSSIFLLPDGK